MKSAVLLAAVVIQILNVQAQLLTFKDGHVGVNFGGYHASAGLGGGAGGGALFAEAGTPWGAQAGAGLGGGAGANGRAGGSLYAGATAGGGVGAAAGLAGGADASGVAGGGLYAGAQAGGHQAGSTLVGGAEQSGGAVITKTATVNGGINAAADSYDTVVPLKHKKVHKTYVASVAAPQPAVAATTNVAANTGVNVAANTDVNVAGHAEASAAANTAKNVGYQSGGGFQIQKTFSAGVAANPTYTNEVYAAAPAPAPALVPVQAPAAVPVYYKRVHHHRRPAYKYAWVTSEPAPVKRVDVDEAAASQGQAVAGVGGSGGGNIAYQVTAQRSPTFFADIFNIPISTLSAVSKFLGNTASGSNISVHKQVSFDGEDASKYSGIVQPGQQDGARPSSFIDDVFSSPGKARSQNKTETLTRYWRTKNVKVEPSKTMQHDYQTMRSKGWGWFMFPEPIPISTLGAVNKFLENNVANRKAVAVTQGDGYRAGRGYRRERRPIVVVEKQQEENKPLGEAE